jgi:hypothetical protein
MEANETEAKAETQGNGARKSSSHGRGMGSIYLRGSTYWVVYYANGRRYRESAHSSKEIDASRLLKRRLGQAASGRPVAPQTERTTLSQLTMMLIADYGANGRRSLDRAEDAVSHLHAFFGEDTRALNITTDSITAYQAHRQQETYKGKPVASATNNLECAMLRRAFRLAARAGKVSVRPRDPDAPHRQRPQRLLRA